MPAEPYAVRVENLNKFRRDLRNLSPEIEKALRDDMKDVAVKVAAEAAVLAPRRTGTLAAGYRGGATSAKAVVRNPVFYARFIEFGFHPGGGSQFVEGVNPIGRAITNQEDRIVDSVGDAIERAAVAVGWH